MLMRREHKMNRLQLFRSEGRTRRLDQSDGNILAGIRLRGIKRGVNDDTKPVDVQDGGWTANESYLKRHNCAFSSAN